VTLRPAKGTSTKSVLGDYPWDDPANIAADQGANMALFGNAGAGKTELACSAVHAATGTPLLVVNFDPDVETIKRRKDLQIWPKSGVTRSWNRIQTFTDRLVTGKHPFKTIVMDTGNNLYRYALADVKASGNPNRDPRQLYGEANDRVNQIIIAFAEKLAQEQGINVIWCWHAEEVKEGQGDTVKVYIRPDATPGVLKTIYQYHSTIGYLEERTQGKRRLYLHNTLKIIAKVHQPDDEDAVAVEIDNPDIGRLIDHLRGVRKYDAGKQSALRARSA
jgi:hypothetical protein